MGFAEDTNEIVTLNNSFLMPKIVDDDKVCLESLGDESTASPEWVKSLIIVEVNVLTGSPNGMFSGMPYVLDHLAEMGVNGIWITPINECRHYGNFGIHTLNAKLTGEDVIAKQWAVARDFVKQAHARNIRVFWDIVSWGVTKTAPLYSEKPEWFKGPSIPQWNGWLWNWENAELREWFTSRMVEMILLTGADGFRCDSEPIFAGYEVFRSARNRLLSSGRKVIFIAEHASARKAVYDFDQMAFVYEGGSSTNTRTPCTVFLNNNIVDVIKSGTMLGRIDKNDRNPDGGDKRFYSYPLTCHDNRISLQSDPVFFGYQAILSPFIPIWYLGDEWNNPDTMTQSTSWKWPNPVQWDIKSQNRDLFETIKKLIRIRREHSDIFENFPADHRTTNIDKVITDRPELCQAYVRFANQKGVIIVPNNGTTNCRIKVTIPYDIIGISSNRNCQINDLMSGYLLAEALPVDLPSITITTQANALSVVLVSQTQTREDNSAN